MSPNKTLYIREDDIPVWDRAEEYAKESSRSVSQLVTELLREHVPVPVSDDELETIELYAEDPHGHGHTFRFRGKWLVPPNEKDHGYEGYDLGTYWGVALTGRGKFAVYSAHCNDRRPQALETHDSLKEAVANLPESIGASAAEALGQAHVIDLDI